MADDAAETPASPPPSKSKGMVGTLVNGIGIFVLSLGAVVAGGSINAKLHPMPDFKVGEDGKMTPIVAQGSSSKGEKGEAPHQATFFAIDPPLVVNFEDGSVVRFLQITMEVMANDPKAVESLKSNLPLIRNNLLLIMSNRNYQSMMSREGKEKLRQEALAEVRAVQKKQGGPDIEDLLFTSFVVQ